MANGSGRDPEDRFRTESDSLDTAARTVNRFLDRSTLKDTLFAIAGTPEFITPSRRGPKGALGQFFPDQDSLTVRAVGYSSIEPDMEVMNAVLAHELGHRLFYKDDREEVGELRKLAEKDLEASGRVSDIPAASAVQATNPIDEAFAQNFEQALQALRSANASDNPEKELEKRISDLEESGRSTISQFVDFLLRRPSFRGTPLGRARDEGIIESAIRVGTAARDATSIGG